MTIKRKIKGGVIGFIGYMLSPLSWWNDMFVNIPLAIAFAWLISLLYPPAFQASVVLGYWLTNVIGLVLLHRGAAQLLARENPQLVRRVLINDLLISLLYTVLIMALVHWHILKPLPDYFSGTK